MCHKKTNDVPHIPQSGTLVPRCYVAPRSLPEIIFTARRSFAGVFYRLAAINTAPVAINTSREAGARPAGGGRCDNY